MKRLYSFSAPSGGGGEGEGEGPGSGEGELYLSSEQVYIRNHTGSLMAVINQEYTFEQTATSTTSLPTYGAGQLGMYNQSDGTYEYHLKDHLGNIRATIQGEKNGESEISLLSMQDYYPFGSPMPGRSIANTSAYKQGYQGQQVDGETSFNAFELRLYDSRLGSWFTPDPYRQHLSPYMAMSNNPFSFIDPDGGWDEEHGNGEGFSGDQLNTFAYIDELYNQCPTCTAEQIGRLSDRQMVNGFISPEYLQEINTEYRKTGERTARYYSEERTTVYIFTIEIYSAFSMNIFNDFDNWGANAGTAAELLGEWLFYGKQDRTFNNDRVANAFRNSRVIGEARDYWYKEASSGRNMISNPITKFKGETRFGGGNFGPSGLVNAGFDPIEQFVGSTSDITISSDGSNITYTITNVTHLKSLLYGLTPEFLNFYNTRQTFIITEPIIFNNINK
ncbi:hypothetical protein GYB57_01220 [bacterium]|nr:hypothetical protein [bacterium]